MDIQPGYDSKHLQRYIVMGVSGSGKSLIGRKLAERLGSAYVEGDEHHSPGNIAKMAAGMPLDDEDRREWLSILQARIALAVQRKESLVLACSALKRRYRDLLRTGDPDLVFVYLEGDRKLIESRMKQRTGHFMPPELLDSQFRDLEPPGADERSIKVNIAAAPDDIVDRIMEQAAAP
jgi:gluconokinase